MNSPDPRWVRPGRSSGYLRGAARERDHVGSERPEYGAPSSPSGLRTNVGPFLRDLLNINIKPNPCGHVAPFGVVVRDQSATESPYLCLTFHCTKCGAILPCGPANDAALDVRSERLAMQIALDVLSTLTEFRGGVAVDTTVLGAIVEAMSSNMRIGWTEHWHGDGGIPATVDLHGRLVAFPFVHERWAGWLAREICCQSLAPDDDRFALIPGVIW